MLNNPDQKYFTCPKCGLDGFPKRSMKKWLGESICFKCYKKRNDEEMARTRAAQAEARQEAEVAMANERDSKKNEAMRSLAGRVYLVQHTEKMEIKDGRETIIVQQMTKVSAVEASKVKPKPMRWLWRNRVPAGAITWGVGKPGNAKSLWSIDLAAHVSTGADFPDGSKNENGPGKVLMYCGEDDLSRTVVPRLIAAGANLDNITLLDNQSFDVYDREYNRVDRRSIDLSQDCGTLSHLIHDNPDIKLLILDPTTGVYGNRNTNQDKDMRPVMSGLRDMCEKRGLTIVGITHTNKRGEAAAIDQIQGASSIAGAARAAWLFTRDPNSDDEHAHLMTCIKSNLSDNRDGLELLTKAVRVSEEVGDHPMIVWGNTTKTQADEANQALKEKRESKNGRRDVCKLGIQVVLSEKPMLSKDVYTMLEKRGHASETIKKAAGELTDEKAIYRRQKGGRWYMALAEHLFEFEQEAEPQPEQTMAAAAGDEL